ncbi:MAG: Mrp/NBP35 family ATP-binding protein [Hyphomonadaceae bacterium]|nr:Mrp/NBP35 family ATP-binding protein [Hyphomonadaceae bacterium]
MNTRLAALEKALEARLDSVKDPVSGKGLFTAGRIAGLAIDANGKASFTIEAPPNEAERYAKARLEAETAARTLAGVTGVTAVLTAHQAEKTPQAAGGAAQVRAIVAVASAKGGVGKSTVAANLACAFAALGLKTGLLDLDVYGPSAPTLLGVAGVKPLAGPNKTIFPIEAHGLKTMSIGYLVDPASPMIWRGAMATSAVRQMLDDVQWGALDVLVLDLPPGTGDVQLTLVQRTPLAGAIIVSTPQEMALADVRRGLAMFEKTHAPILGVIENMAYFEDSAGKRTHIFGEGGARRTAEQAGVPFLGEIPIDVSLRESADAGAPLVVTAPESATAQRFREIAQAALDNITRIGKPAPKIALV